MSKLKHLLCSIALTALVPTIGYATQLPTSHKADGRVLHFHYEEGEVYHVDVNFRYITMIQFEPGEVVNAIQIGDSEGFQVSRLNRGDIITIKPLIEDARTNMNIITSKRIYTFFINAVQQGRRDGQNFRLYFKYGPDERNQTTFVSLTSGTKATGARVNTGYQTSGKADFVPIEIYDDGVNTWLKYKASARRPAIFQTNARGEESVINYTAHPDHRIQLHGLSDNWTLRIGNEIVCIRKAP